MENIGKSSASPSQPQEQLVVGTKRQASNVSDDSQASLPNKKVAMSPTNTPRPTLDVHDETLTNDGDDESKPCKVLEPLNRDGKNLTEKKIRRLEKNRLSARNCRRKKKELEQHLLKEITTLEGENLKLRLQLKIGEEAEQLSLKEQERLTEELNALLKSGASDSDIRTNLEEFKTKFMDYGLDRRTAIDFHLRNVERLLMPTTITSVAMRALKGGNNNNGNPQKMKRPDAMNNTAEQNSVKGLNDISQKISVSSEQNQMQESTSEAVDNKKDESALEPKTLFKYLVQHLDVTKEQALELKDSRHVAKELDSALEKALSMLQELRHCLTQSVEVLETEFETVQSILSDRQTAKFLVWVANNSACLTVDLDRAE